MEIKPCPFCGSNHITLCKNSEFDSYYLMCDKCSGQIVKSEHELPNLKIDKSIEYEIDENECLLEFWENKTLTGLEPLVKAWNTRSDAGQLRVLDAKSVLKWNVEYRRKNPNNTDAQLLVDLASEFGVPQVTEEEIIFFMRELSTCIIHYHDKEGTYTDEQVIHEVRFRELAQHILKRLKGN